MYKYIFFNKLDRSLVSRLATSRLQFSALLLSFGGHVGKITNDGGYFGCNNSVNSGLKQKPRPPLVVDTVFSEKTIQMTYITKRVRLLHHIGVESNETTSLRFSNRDMSVDFDRILKKKQPACLISFAVVFGVITQHSLSTNLNPIPLVTQKPLIG